MTTVDVTIESLDGTESIWLHNGFSGPATLVASAIYEQCQLGVAKGRWIVGDATVTMTGSVVREVLAAAGDFPGAYGQAEMAVRAFLEGISDSAVYQVETIEF